MTHGSLFSGIGGFDLAAEWMGWQNMFHCEWNEFGQKVLHHYWPDAEQFTDITKSDFKKYANRISILTGGFPCQPYSLAGKRKGKEDERHLWPEMLRAIREIRPRWVVGENVFGLVNWSGGLVFHEVQADLEAEGYEVFPYVLPACGVNAPHRRDRVWFVAYNNSLFWREGWNAEFPEQSRYRKSILPATPERIVTNPYGDGFNGSYGKHEINSSEGGEYALGNLKQSNGDGNAAHPIGQGRKEREQNGGWPDDKKNSTGVEFRDERFGGNGITPNTNSGIGLEGGVHQARPKTTERHFSSFNTWHDGESWKNFPTVSPVCDGDDGIPRELDGITFSKWRQESIKAGGNAIVPQVALQIFKAIEQYENLKP